MRFRRLFDPDENTIISFDFWDTILFNLESPQDRWQATMNVLIEEFHLEQEAETYEIWFDKISKSIRNLNKDNGNDFELTSSSVWNYFSSLIFTEFSQRELFQKRAQEIYFQFAVSNTVINPFFKDFYLNAKNKPRIFIISDYEYGSFFIHKLLSIKGIDFPLQNIFVSSDFLMNKFSGNLYFKISELFKGKQFYHLGDDFKSDFLMARKSGFKTIYCARLDRTIYRKLNYLKKRYIAQLKKIPLRISTFKNDIALLVSALYQYKLHITQNLLPRDTVFFLGSEGAFFSNLFDQQFHLQYSSSCINLGRKEILRVLFPIDPDFVFTILLLEELSLVQMLNYLNSFTPISDFELIEYLNKNFQKFRNRNTSFESQGFLQWLQPSLSSPGRIVTIDIGYKATFSSALSRIQSSQVVAFQLLGFTQIQTATKLNVISLQNVEIPAFGRPFSTKYLENLFGTGPRNEFYNHLPLVKIQQLMLKSKPRRFLPTFKLVRFSRFPSKKIRKAINLERTDDLRMNKKSS